ncbi:MAG: hypothetical protein GY702_27845 [Desulfobulbaceae bacterium]|nr:hypothetical protein [Desulfobulbaceae bacterium]
MNDPCDVTSNSNAFSDPLVVNVSGFVTPPSSGLTTTITASVPDGHGGLPLPTPVVATTTTQLDGTFTAAINIPNPNGIDQVDVVSSVAGASETAQCSVSFSSIEVSLDGPCNVTTTSTISSDPFIITVSGLVTPLSAGHTVTITASVPEGWGGLPLPTPVEVTTTTAVDGTYVAVIDIPNPNGLGKLDVVTSVAGSSETEQCTTPCLISCD